MSRSLVPVVVLLVLSSASTIVLMPVCHADNDSQQSAGKAAAIASEVNFAAFRVYKCRFTYTKADAASPEEAVNGNYTNLRKCEFLLAIDGDKRKFQSLTPIDTTPPKDLQEGIEP